MPLPHYLCRFIISLPSRTRDLRPGDSVIKGVRWLTSILSPSSFYVTDFLSLLATDPDFILGLLFVFDRLEPGGGINITYSGETTSSSYFLSSLITDSAVKKFTSSAFRAGVASPIVD